MRWKERIIFGVVAMVSLFAEASPVVVFPKFTEPERGRVLSFPRDHGAHGEFTTEWWYYTGHLFGVGEELFRDRARYGFQLTFFRQATRPSLPLNPFFQGFLAHGALSNLREQRFHHEKRAAVGGVGIAGAATNRLHAWNHSWEVEDRDGVHHLSYGVDGFQVDLRARPVMPPVLQGEGGYSVKGESITIEGNRFTPSSHYYSLPWLTVEGTVRSRETEQPVHGVAWMDHEFMSGGRDTSLIGWDWLSLHLHDRRSLMVFRVRRTGGDFFSGTVISQAGTPTAIRGHEFEFVPKGFWDSPLSGARYPVRWQLTVPAHQIALTISTPFTAQELASPHAGAVASPVYWEGAVESEPPGAAFGYLEMVGYDRPLGALF